MSRPDEVKRFCEAVVLELTEMKKLGMKVTKKALAYAANESLMQEYTNMSVSDAADLVRDLA